MITVDPHIVPKDETEVSIVAAQLKSAVLAFVTAPVIIATIPCEDPSKIRRAQLLNMAVEIGEKYGREHVHFNLNLTHRTKILLKHPDGRTINDEVQKWFNARLGRSCFASVRLADTSRAKNYATKSGTSTDEPANVSITGAQIRAAK